MISRNIQTKILLLAISAFCLQAQMGLAQNHEELGAVEWLRDFDKASTQAAATGKPILLLFQEVPGCMTCRNYGSQVLSHPFIVEAIEEYFVPLAIFNNRKGKDAQILKHYGEPSWNNPVVRFVTDEGKDFVPRLNGNYKASGLVEKMLEVMTKRGVEVPAYLQLAYDEMQMEDRGLEKITFSMFCFWTGEKVYGQVEGVAYTEAGFMDGHEVVNVYFDPSITSLQYLIEVGKKGASADGIYCKSPEQKNVALQSMNEKVIHSASKFRLDKEPQYYVSRSVYRSIPMGKLQRTRVNALLGQGKSVDHLLSPKQRALLLP